MEILIKYEYNNVVYCVARKNNRLVYFYIKDNKKCYDLNKKQLKIMNEVVYKLLVPGEFIKLMDYKYKGREYQVYFDTNTNLRYFMPCDNKDDLIKLNYLFNNQEEYLYSIKDGKRDENGNYIKRIVKVGKDYIVCLLMATIMFGSYFTLVDPVQIGVPPTSVSEELALADKEIVKDDFVNELITIINNNKNITDREKKIWLSNINLFIDNEKYFDIDHVKEILSTIKSKCNSSSSGDAAGTYNFVDNVINYYNVNNIDEVEDYVISHEFLHALTLHVSHLFNNFLIETTNVIFNEEYFNKENSTYTDYYNYTKALIMIVGSEPFRQFQCCNSLEPIVNALSEIHGNGATALKLFCNLDDYRKIYDDTEMSLAEKQENLSRLRTLIYDQIDTYYYHKYGENIKDNLLMSYYMNDLRMYDLIGEMKEKYNVECSCAFEMNDGVIFFNENKKDDNSGLHITAFAYVTSTYFEGGKPHTNTIKQVYFEETVLPNNVNNIKKH